MLHANPRLEIWIRSCAFFRGTTIDCQPADVFRIQSPRPTRFAVQRTGTVPWSPPPNFVFPILWPPTVTSTPSFEIGLFITAQTVEFRFAFSVMSVSFPFAWHCFGLNHAPCTTRSFCFPGPAQRISFSNRSLRSLRPSVKFSGSPQECIRFGIWEHAPLAIPCPSKRAQKGHFNYEFQSAYPRWFYWSR